MAVYYLRDATPTSTPNIPLRILWRTPPSRRELIPSIGFLLRRTADGSGRTAPCHCVVLTLTARLTFIACHLPLRRA